MPPAREVGDPHEKLTTVLVVLCFILFVFTLGFGTAVMFINKICDQ